MALDAAEAVRGRDVQEVVASSLQRAQETAAPDRARSSALPVTTDDRLLESTNHFEGKTFGVGDGALRQPAQLAVPVNPFQPSLGRAVRGRRGPDARRRPTTSATASAATRPSASATSCRSGRCAATSRAAASGTAPTAGCAGSPR